MTETAAPEWMPSEAAAESEVVDADVVQEMSAPAGIVDGEAAPPGTEPELTAKARGRGRRAKPEDARPAAEKKPRARKTASAKPRPAKKPSPGRKAPAHVATDL